MKISYCNQYRICSPNFEPMLHVFFKCNIYNTLWKYAISCIDVCASVTINLDSRDKAIGYIHQDYLFRQLHFPLNVSPDMILLLVQLIIKNHRHKDTTHTKRITHTLKHRHKDTYNTRKENHTH